MLLASLVELAQREKLPPLQRKVLDHLEDHPNEVFEYRDSLLVEAVGGKPSSVGFSLWALHKRHLIEKQEVAGKVYFGSKKAMADLRAQIGASAGDPFERATRNLRRIREEVGNIDVLNLLDETREGN